MSDLKEVRAALDISVNVTCPHCDFCIDLLCHEDTNEININDDGLNRFISWQ